MSERDGTCITLLLSLALCSVWWLTPFDITELDQRDPLFQHWTEEEIAADGVKASATHVEEEYGHGLDNPQESTFKKKLLSFEKYDNDAVIN